ncbi:Pcyt2, partial [Symbiodinium necroappetens]
MIMPLFNLWAYPEEDWSPHSFMDILEASYSRSAQHFPGQLQELVNFFSDKSYFPWRVRAKSDLTHPAEVLQVLPWIAQTGPPKRISNSVVFGSTHILVDFDFSEPNRLDAWMNVVLLLLVMVLMIGFSLVLSNSVSSIVLKPLEQLLTQVRQMASTIFQSVTDMEVVMKEPANEANSEQDDLHETKFGNETQLLAKVVQKLAVISEITMNKPMLDVQLLQNLAENDRAVISGFQGGLPAQDKLFDRGDEMENALDMESIELAQRAMVENAGLSMELLDSWNLNPLELDKARNHVAAMYFCSSHNHGVEFDSVIMGNFLSEAESGYVKSAPYHNWFHAVDCAHAVYRLLQMCIAEVFLTREERYALLASAVCHDLGHPGLNNVFLIETSHELALRYNDKSPLENMHCSKMFELVSQARCNIFSTLSKTQYFDVRKVCIESILHTDNAQHFTMVKDVQMLYEVNSEIWDASRLLFLQEGGDFLAQEAVDLLRLVESRKLWLSWHKTGGRCFDIMHSGHYNAIRQAKSICDVLVVGIHSDQEIADNKSVPVMKQTERYGLLDHIKWIDEILYEVPYSPEMATLERASADFCIHGDDMPVNAQGVCAYDEMRIAGRLRIIKRTEGVSTTDLIGRLLTLSRNQPADFGGQQSPNMGYRISPDAAIEQCTMPAAHVDFSDSVREALLAVDQLGESYKINEEDLRSLKTKITAAAAPQPSSSFVEGGSSPAQPGGSQQRTKAPVQLLASTRRIREFSTARQPTSEDKVIYACGSFDMFHVGHAEFLKEARALGTFLLVGIYDDASISRARGQSLPVMNLNERVLNVCACKWVDEVIIGAPRHITEDLIKTWDIHIVARGSSHMRTTGSSQRERFE